MSQSETRVCGNCEKSFVIESSDFEFYKRLNTIPPRMCPRCRMEKRLGFWPFGKFHKRTCDLTGEKMISVFPPDAGFPVYLRKHWYSDEWNPPEMEYDSTKPFFEQILELHSKSPRPHQFGEKNENCEYGDDAWESKNCYLSRSFLRCENLWYSYRAIRCKDSSDLLYCFDADQSYDCIYCFKVFRVKHAFDTRDSMESAFLYDCRNVQNCFMCWNLRNKQYHIMNVPYSKEEYEKKLKEYNLGSREGFERARKDFEEKVKTEAIHKATFNTKVQNVSGDYLTECKNCQECYFFEESEDCKFMHRGLSNKNSQDGTGILRGELIYDINQLTDGYMLKHSNFCTNCRESEYLDFCENCEYCFGCIGIKNKKFCIFNKQYTEEEYKKLITRIKEDMKKKGEYGEFFPLSMAYIGYNLTLGGIIFSKTKEQIESLGGRWEELEKPQTKGLDIVGKIDDIQDVGEEIIKKAIICKETGRPFNITRDELTFLKQHSITLPELYPDVRTMHRVQKLLSVKERKVNCHFCKKEIITYRIEELRYEKISCIECYNKEVI